MAIQLIKANANPRVVLMNYLATERNLKNTNIDITGIDLTRINLIGIDLSDVNSDDIPTLNPYPFLPDEELIVRKIFEQDLLAMLSIFSRTVASILQQSPTRDKENGEMEKFKAHGPALLHVRSYKRDDPLNIYNVIKLAVGNCGEMAKMSGIMLDLYLENAFNPLGYPDISFQTCVKTAADIHSMLYVTCTFLGDTTDYIVDPWSHGKAWSATDGMRYFQHSGIDGFNDPEIKFVAETGIRPPRSDLLTICEHFRIKEQLDVMIKKNKLAFIGCPMPGLQFSTVKLS